MVSLIVLCYLKRVVPFLAKCRQLIATDAEKLRKLCRGGLCRLVHLKVFLFGHFSFLRGSDRVMIVIVSRAKNIAHLYLKVSAGSVDRDDRSDFRLRLYESLAYRRLIGYTVLGGIRLI